MPAKPSVKLRVPPPAVSLERVAAESFVRGRRLDVQASGRVLARADGRELRRRTVYLPVALDRELAVYCATHDLDVSEALAAMVAAALGAQG